MTATQLHQSAAAGRLTLEHSLVFHSQRGPMDVLNGDRLTVPAGTICKVEQTEPDCVLLSFWRKDQPSARWFAWLHAANEHGE